MVMIFSLESFSGNTDVDSFHPCDLRSGQNLRASSFILQIHAGYKKACGEAQYLFLIQADIHAAGAVEKQLFQSDRRIGKLAQMVSVQKILEAGIESLRDRWRHQSQCRR